MSAEIRPSEIRDCFDNSTYQDTLSEFAKKNRYLTEETGFTLNEIYGIVTKHAIDALMKETKEDYLLEKFDVFRLMTETCRKIRRGGGCSYYEDMGVKFYNCASIIIDPSGEETEDDEGIVGCMFFHLKDTSNGYKVTELELYELLPKDTEVTPEIEKARKSFCRHQDELSVCANLYKECLCSEMVDRIKKHNKKIRIVSIDDLIDRRYHTLMSDMKDVEDKLKSDVNPFIKEIKEKTKGIFPEEAEYIR